MSDKPVKVFECVEENRMCGEGEWIETGFDGEPGRYFRVEDVKRMVEAAFGEAWVSGRAVHRDREHLSDSALLGECFERSQTAARLRAIMGE